MKVKQPISKEEQSNLIEKLKIRFEENMHRHPAIKWEDLETKLLALPDKILILKEMESTGGEPDVVGQDENSGEYIFFDCAKESPKDRRNLCYDRQAQLQRKKYPSKNNVEDMVNNIGIALLTESQYSYLQKLDNFDTKTSSWIKTPEKIRKLGGALFADFRYDSVFIYHNGADSYYASRGFRGSLRI